MPPPFAQILKCPNCNAPLEAPASSGAVFCTYCGSQVIVQQRTLAPAPPHPRAPQPLPAVGSAAQLRWIVSSLVGAGVIIAVTALFVVGSLRTAASSRLSAQNTGTVEIVPARLREVVMSQTLAQLASWAGVKANSEARLELSLKGSRFQSLVFYWPTPGAVDITQVMLSARMPIVKGDPVLTALSAVFGARFTGDTEGGTTFESNALRFSVRSREVEVRVWPEKHPNWQRKMAVLWQVARALVLQEPIEIDAVTRRDVLGTGYPLRALGQVNTGRTRACTSARPIFGSSCRIPAESIPSISKPWSRHWPPARRNEVVVWTNLRARGPQREASPGKLAAVAVEEKPTLVVAFRFRE